MVGCPMSKIVISTDHSKGFGKAIHEMKTRIIFYLLVLYLCLLQKWQILNWLFQCYFFNRPHRVAAAWPIGQARGFMVDYDRSEMAI